MILPRAARAVGDVVFEVRVAAPDLEHARERLLRERRAAEVRVHDHAGRVQHAAQACGARDTELLPQPRGQVAGIRSRTDLLARPREHRARRGDRERIVDVARQLVHGGKIAQPHQCPFRTA